MNMITGGGRCRLIVLLSAEEELFRSKCPVGQVPQAKSIIIEEQFCEAQKIGFSTFFFYSLLGCILQLLLFKKKRLISRRICVTLGVQSIKRNIYQGQPGSQLT